MGEIKRELKTYEVNYICDFCQQGFMVAADATPTSYLLTAYAHQCEKCGHKQCLKSRYPQRRVE